MQVDGLFLGLTHGQLTRGKGKKHDQEVRLGETSIDPCQGLDVSEPRSRTIFSRNFANELTPRHKQAYARGGT
jgi:hypothetical protein